MDDETSFAELKGRFIHLALLDEAKYEGNIKAHHKARKELNQIYKYLEKNHGIAIKLLSELQQESNVNVVIWACAYSLALGVLVEGAEKKLRSISRRKDPYSLDAHGILDIWKKQGNLQPY